MSKVIILGAGRGQIPLYDICSENNYEVVFVTPNGNYPGVKKKAEMRFADVRNYEAVYNIAKNENADAIISDQLDAGVFSCAYASEKLGLIGIGSETAKKFTDKYIMRKCAEKAGVNVPWYIGVHSVEEVFENQNAIKYPLIMKPSDNASSRGVYLVDNENELLCHFEETKNYSTEGLVILEQYIKGKEYVVESYTKGYSITDLIIGHRDYFNIEKRFIPKATVFRDACIADEEIERKVLDVNRKLIQEFGLPFGITHGEYLYCEEDKKIYLVEIAARGGGEFISDVLIPAACGIHANRMLVKHVLGIPYEIPVERKMKSSAYYSYMLCEGTITSIKGTEKVKKLSGVINPMFDNIAVNMHVDPPRDKASRKGPLLVQGKCKEDCYKVKEKIKSILDIEVDNNGFKGGIIWD
ncbi:MAG: ATP-grasp domain-containing protein [Eubacterium sp.]|nr:ATP-grasp domain-containing protein [Eubacterium sp.]